jgi:hypothetical protein
MLCACCMCWCLSWPILEYILFVVPLRWKTQRCEIVQAGGFVVGCDALDCMWWWSGAKSCSTSLSFDEVMFIILCYGLKKTSVIVWICVCCYLMVFSLKCDSLGACQWFLVCLPFYICYSLEYEITSIDRLCSFRCDNSAWSIDSLSAFPILIEDIGQSTSF